MWSNPQPSFPNGWIHYRCIMTQSHSRTAEIRQAALDCGFSSVGVAAADMMTGDVERYLQWIELGYHGTMSYLERNSDKREDPHLILPGVQSVVVVTQNYYTPYSHENYTGTPDTHGKISRYAWGDDYHDVIPPKLRLVAEKIHELVPGSECKIYTDTGPVMEKAWAVRAGIGWQGKHSNIISKAKGSWFFIGVLFTTAYLEPDTPIGDYCGTCTACLDACPTQAIVEPYVVDATKCLSYWTIETKPDSEIPPAIASSLDGWIFGCDTCQDVCPWNRFRTPTTEQRFEPRRGETKLEFEAISQYTQEQFSERFRKSPVKRTKLAGLQRNVRAAKLSKSIQNKE